MRISIIFIFGLLASLSWGKSDSQLGEKVEMLKFEEFIKLGEADREEYLETMREFVLKLEREQSVSREDAVIHKSLWAMISVGEAMAATGDDCIYAGYISTMGANGHCSPPASKTWNYGGQSRTLCSGGGTACNPMIYGFGADGNGICTTSKSSPTVDCDNKYRKIPNYGGAQIAKQLMDSGLGKDFDAESGKFSKYCGSAGSSSQQTLCKYASDRNSYLKKKIAAAEKTKQPKKILETKPANAETAKSAKVAPKVAATPPVAEKPESVSRPKSPPSVSAPSSPSSPAPKPAAASAAPTKDVTAPASTAPAKSPAASVDKPAAKPAEAKAPEKPVAPKDNCVRSAADFVALRDKFPKELQNLDKPGKSACLILPPQNLVLTTTIDVPGAIMIQMEAGILQVSTYVSPPSVSGRPIMEKESIAKEICLRPPGLHVTYRPPDHDTTDVAIVSGGLKFFDPKNPKESTLFNYGDPAKCAAIKKKVQAAALADPGRVERSPGQGKK